MCVSAHVPQHVGLKPAFSSCFSTLWVQEATQDLRLRVNHFYSLSHRPGPMCFQSENNNRAGEVLQFLEHLSSLHEVLDSILRIDGSKHPYNSNTEEVDAGGSEAQGHAQQHNKSEASLGYMTPSL